MSNLVLATSIVALEDGKLLVTLSNGKTEYLQPSIVVDSLVGISIVEVRGKDKNQVDVKTSINSIDGVPFSGTYAQLETSLRNLAKKANGLYNGGVGGGGGGDVNIISNTTDFSTATKQDEAKAEAEETNDKLSIKYCTFFNFSQSFGIPFPGYPMTITQFEWKNLLFQYPVPNVVVNNDQEVADLWNTYVFENSITVNGTNEFCVWDGTESILIDPVDSIIISTTVGPLIQSVNDWTTQRNPPTSNLDEILSKNLETNEKLQKIIENTCISGSAFTANTNGNILSLGTAGNERLLLLFRVKATVPFVKIKKMLSHVLSLNNDDFIVHLAILKDFDHVFVDANYQSIDPSSGIEVAIPGVLGVPNPTTSTGFFPGGRDVFSDAEQGNSKASLYEDTVIELPTMVTYSLTCQGVTNGANVLPFANWTEMNE